MVLYLILKTKEWLNMPKNFKKLTFQKIIKFLSVVLIPISLFTTSFVFGEMITQNYSFTNDTFSFIELRGEGTLDIQVTHKPHTSNAIVTIDSKVLPYFKIYVKNKTLYIRNNEDLEFFSRSKTKIKLEVDNLNSLTLNGSANISANNIKSNSFLTNINGSGSANFQGSSDDLSVIIKGSANVDARKLISKNSKIAIYGSGRVLTNASNKINVEIYGSGSVKYLGNPKDVKQAIYGSGSVESLR